MSIREQIRYAGGLREDYLNEGIVIFRNSKRIEKLINKIQKAEQYAIGSETKQEVANYVRELQRAKLDFESVEQKYISGNKEEAKEEYKALRIKFARIVTDINKESVKKFLITAGVATLVFSIFASIIPTHSPIPEVPSTATHTMVSRDSLTSAEKTIRAEIHANNLALSGLKDKVRTFDLFGKNQKLIERLAQEQSKLQRKLIQ